MNSEICTKKYYVYNEVLAGIQLVKNFLQANRQILVGGQSIDYAIRLKGGKLYDDWEIPDLDFVTDDYANVAYDIFKVIGTKLSERINISVLNAMHPTTMRVQVAKFSVADVTFIPTRILEMYKLSTLEYDGCLIRHPFFQYVDIQRSFSYPYENTMMEVITHRWEKDFKRLLLTMKYYSPHDKELVSSFVSKYHIKKNSTLSKLGYKKNRLHRMSKISPSSIAHFDSSELLTLYKELNKTSVEKELTTIGVINGELAYLIYRSIYKNIMGNSFDHEFITGDEKRLKYKGCDYFLNSYLMTNEDKEKFFALNPKLEDVSRETNPYIDIIPSRLICDTWELVGIEHRTAYHSINLKKINPSYPNVTVKVVSINYLILYICMLWVTLRTSIYLSLYIKLLKMIERVYNSQDDNPMLRLLFPSIETYGNEIPHIFERNKVSITKPTNIYINKYNNLETAVNSIKKFEYQEVYNLDGM